MADSNKGGKKGGNQQGGKGKAPQEKSESQPEQKTEKKPQNQEKKPQNQEKKPQNQEKKVEKKEEPKQNAPAPSEEKKSEKKEEVKAAPAPKKETNNNSANESKAKDSKEKKEPKEKKEKQVGKGVVKSVLSGDTVVVIDLSKNRTGAPTDKIISISNLNAPTMGRRKGEEKGYTPDKPFAWQSREFLRKRLIGKTVSYVIEASPQGANKEYGYIFLNENNKEINIAREIVEHGWAEIRRPEHVKEYWTELQEMVDLEEAAKQAKKGIFNDNKTGAVRPITEVNPTELFAKLKGTPQFGVIEYVKTGSSLRIILTPSFYEINLLLSGVECGSVPREGKPDPFGREAKFYTEHFLLNREVSIIIEGADKKNFYGTVCYRNADNKEYYISEELLREGLGKYVDWSGNRTAFSDRLKAAENQAKEKKLRLWSNFEAKTLTRQEEKKALKPGKEIIGKVIEVVNAGCIQVLDSNGTPHKLYLSSVKVPRQGGPDKQESKEELREKALAWEAKEFLRKRLIGNKVRCVLDYARTVPAKKNTEEERIYSSVYLEKNNIAVELVDQGFALPQEHRGGEARSKDYEHLIFAETRASKAQRGQHAPQDKIAAYNVVEIEDIKTAKAKFPFLERHGRMRGVVEFVISCSRLKVYVPKENCNIILSLGSVSTPPKRDNPAMFDSALNFTKEKCHQHDIEFDVTAVMQMQTEDPKTKQPKMNGFFLGSVWVNKTPLAGMLLEEGFVKIFRGANRDPELIACEESAKRNKKNLWKDYDEAEEARKKKAREETHKEKTQPKRDLLDVIVTEIVDGYNFFVQIVGKGAEELEDIMNKLAVEDSTEAYTPKQGELVKAQFTADDAWYRAEVLNVQEDGFKVKYVDYGNTEVIPASRIRKLPEEFKKLGYQAHEAVLAYIKTPPIEDDNGKEAAEYFKELVWGKTMIANVEGREELDNKRFKYSLSLGDRESQIHVNAALLRAGLAKVEKVKGRLYEQIKDFINKLREEESKAKSAHLGIWEYGDPGSDEEEEEKRGGNKKRT